MSFLIPGPRCIAFDGKFIFLISSSLKHLLKLGSGKKGTIKGLVYASVEICPGWLVHADGRLLHHKLHPGGGAFCRLLNKDTLKVSARVSSKETQMVMKQILQVEGEVALESEPAEILQTFQLMSDGKTLYWLYAMQTQEMVTHPATGEKIKQHPLILQALNLKVGIITIWILVAMIAASGGIAP